MKRLLFTEKPAVGNELASYLGKKNKITPEKSSNGRYIVVGDDVVIWAVGHLMGLAEPDHYFRNKGFKENKNGKYSWHDVPLPIIPKKFENLPSVESADKRAQLAEIGRLMKSVPEIWNAGDSDREGQLIFDEIRDYFSIDKPVKRIMFSALNDDTFDRAFASVGNNSDPAVANAGIAARCRSYSDWLIGMNITRALSLSIGDKLREIKGFDGKSVLNIGRVLTPTVSIVVRRQKEIENFKPVAFYTPSVKMSDGTVLLWNKRISEDQAGIVDGRIVDKRLAQKIIDTINQGLRGKITESKSVEKSEAPPLPYSLPAIQSELSKRYGLTVDEISKACQSLYEKKMQTYVGTDCRFLPESMHADANKVLRGLSGKYTSIVDKSNISIKYSCWDDSKVSGEGGAAHHAIVPTGDSGPIGSEAERIVYDAVCRRYIAQFHPEHKYLSMAIVGLFGADEFKATAKATVLPGWKVVDDYDEETKDRDVMREENKVVMKNS